MRRKWGSGENARDSRMWICEEGCSRQQAEDEQDAGLSPGRGSRTPVWGCSCSGHRPVMERERSQLCYPLSHMHLQFCMAWAAPNSPWQSRTPNIPKLWHSRTPDISTCPSTVRLQHANPLRTQQDPQRSGTLDMPTPPGIVGPPTHQTPLGTVGPLTSEHPLSQQDPQHDNIPCHSRIPNVPTSPGTAGMQHAE